MQIKTILKVTYDNKNGTYHAYDIDTNQENTEPRQIMMRLAHDHNQHLYLKKSKWRRASLDKIQKNLNSIDTEINLVNQ